MNSRPDNDLHTIFAQQRRCDHEHAPAWRPELLHRPLSQPSSIVRWVPAALVTAGVIALAVFLTEMPRHQPPLSEVLPPLLDSPPGELFASLEPSLLAFEAPSDFLLPHHLNHPTP